MPSVIHYVGINDTRIKNGSQPDEERKGRFKCFRRFTGLISFTLIYNTLPRNMRVSGAATSKRSN